MRGEAGIGKTTLLRHAVKQAGDMLVLQTLGIESESEISFAGLSDLIRPLLGLLGKIPAPQAAALAGALAVGPPVSGSEFAIYAATLSILAEAAEESPVLVVVDDVQWLDGSSAEALMFTARRVRAEGIGLLFGLRDAEPASASFLGIPDLALSGLGEDDAIALLSSRATGTIDPAVAVHLARATAGNPLALLELPTILSVGQLAGNEPIDDPLPVGRTVERVLLRRVSALPAATQRALLVPAASPAGTLEAIDWALKSLGNGLADLEPAETAGLISICESRFEFCHPLVRSAVYYGAPAATRRMVHRALADAFSKLNLSQARERRAWHLAAATLVPDEHVARELEAAAESARQRGSFVAAAGALEQAARLTPASEDRALRLLHAADAAQAAGRVEKALALVEEALALSESQSVRAVLQCQRGRILTWRGAPVLARDLLIAEASQIEATDPVQAAQLLVSATLSCLLTADMAVAAAAAERAVALSDREAAPEILDDARLLLALVSIVRGEVDRGRLLLAECRQFLEDCDPVRTQHEVLIGALCFLALEDFEEARRLAERTVKATRAASAIGLLPFELAWLATIEFRMGYWTAAYAGAHEAIGLAEETGWLTELPNALIALAEVEAGRGAAEDCRAHAQAALNVAEAIGAVYLEVRARYVLGLLEFGLGQAANAVEHLERCAHLTQTHQYDEPVILNWASNLVEAYLRAGRVDDARWALDALEHQAKQRGLVSVQASAARCRGLLANDGADQHFVDALALHAQVPMPFERARTELCFAQVLRRQRRRAEARRWLRSALATFEHLGAAPWIDQARAELQATGERARRRDVSTSQQLTPQELQVALVVGRGATNREAAAAFFLSTKTIEFHLGNIYRKLGVQSRAQLAYLLAAEGALQELTP